MTATAPRSDLGPAPGQKVLIVEDDPAMTELLFALLAPFCEVHVEHDGFAGLSAFRRSLFYGKPFELVCLDLMMPGMDGRRTLRAIRRLETASETHRGHRARIVMMTTQRERDLVLDAVEAGVDGFLIKPFVPAELLVRLGLIAEADAVRSAEA